MTLYNLIYRSQASYPFSDSELTGLLAECRIKNAQSNISGILLYGYGFFIQLLEGNKHEIKELFERIAADTRHHSVKVLREGPAEKRLYAQWAMAFRPYDPEAVIQMPGYIDPDTTSVYGRNLLSPLQTLQAMEMLSMEVNNRNN
jgi:hypothetical protein